MRHIGAGERNRTAALRITKAALLLGATPAQVWSWRRDLEPSAASLQMRGCALRASEAHRAGVEPAVGRLTAACLSTWLPVNEERTTWSSPCFSSTNRRGMSSPRSCARAAPKSCLIFKGQAAREELLVRGERIERSSAVSETACLPLANPEWLWVWRESNSRRLLKRELLRL